MCLKNFKNQIFRKKREPVYLAIIVIIVVFDEWVHYGHRFGTVDICRLHVHQMVNVAAG